MPNQFPGAASPNLPKQPIPIRANCEGNALAESERRRLAALDAADVGTWSWNPATNEIAWDSRCKTLFGLPETAPNTTYQDFFSHLYPEDRKLTEDALQNLLDEKGDYDIIHRVIWPDKSIHWLRCKGQYGKGLFREVVGLTVEVTWLKRSEEERF